MSHTWYCQDGRVLKVSEMDLDHLINSWHMAAYMVATMRKKGVDALGGLSNRNVALSTMDAFVRVQPSDVFPAYDEIKMLAREKFYARFGVELVDIKRRIFDAWNAVEPMLMPAELAAPIRFMLTDRGGRPLQVNVTKLTTMLKLADVRDDDGFQRVCWNLRRDQRQVWQHITDHGLTSLVKRIPHARLRSALDFEVARPIRHDEAVYDDIPFGIGYPV